MREDGIGGTIARQEWLKPTEEALQRLLHQAFGFSGGRHVKNFLHGTWLGHPLHVILTDVPIGAWTAAIAFDALESMTGRRAYGVAADAAVATGLIGAVGAATTGLTDWQDIDPPARRIGLVHGLLNVISASLFTGSLVARKRRSRSNGRNLAALGYAVSTMAAYLGGNLVYEQKIGVDHTASEKLPDNFVRVAADSDVPPRKPVRVDYNGIPILLVRQGSQIYALAETCAHLGGPLSEGKLEDDTISCPWHGSRYSLQDGHVVDGPSVHPQPCLEARVVNGQIEVRRSNCKPTDQVSKKSPSSARSERRRATSGQLNADQKLS
jgi:nitrite reductase/ring-hydroxylating ferredoxin subunit/uncharacterized membrane protein